MKDKLLQCVKDSLLHCKDKIVKVYILGEEDVIFDNEPCLSIGICIDFIGFEKFNIIYFLMIKNEIGYSIAMRCDDEFGTGFDKLDDYLFIGSISDTETIDTNIITQKILYDFL